VAAEFIGSRTTNPGVAASLTLIAWPLSVVSHEVTSGAKQNEISDIVIVVSGAANAGLMMDMSRVTDVDTAALTCAVGLGHNMVANGLRWAGYLLSPLTRDVKCFADLPVGMAF